MVDDFQALLERVRALPRAELLTLDAAVRTLLNTPPPNMPTEPPSDMPGPGPTPSAEAAGRCRGDRSRVRGRARVPALSIQAHRQVGLGQPALRRYRCKDCNVSFNCLTGTPLAQLHKRELWSGHAQALVDGISLRKVAARLEIDLTTAFRWRHRFLKAPKTVKAQRIQGTVEADETFFRRSFKGCRLLHRKPHKRGGHGAKPGLSDDQVPVLIAQDRTAEAATTDAILPDRSAAAIEAHLAPVIDRRSVLVTDADGAFSAFANKLEIAHVSLNASRQERSWEGYHIQHVNAYCSELKGWMSRFRGVATKYLDSYLGWHRMNNRDGDTQTARGVLAAAWG